jgi:glycerophosphoryl diester phosphodiesterase
VRLTADDAPVLLHDDRLERTTNGQGKASAVSLAELRTLDAGGWFGPGFAGEAVPTLAQAVAVLAELGLGANVELKAERGRAQATGAVVGDLLGRAWPAGLPGLLVSSFAVEALEAVRDRAPQIARGILFGRVPPHWQDTAEALGCLSVHADHRLMTRGVAARIRKAGYPLLAYTVNDAARARRLFDWGVTSVFSDVPHIILSDRKTGGEDGQPRDAGLITPGLRGKNGILGRGAVR